MFEPIKLEWHGKPVEIAASRVLGAIGTIESVVTYNELQSFAMRGAYPGARIASAYGALLRYAGEQVTDEQVYEGLFQNDEETGNVVGSMRLLMMLMIPPSLRNGSKPVKPVLQPGETERGNLPAAKRSRRKGSSTRSTRSSSRKAGARR